MFCDQTVLTLLAGNGGNGTISFRREKFVERGGPNGGDGGKGGDIFFKVSTAINSLIHLHTYKKFQAEKGEPGQGQNKHGKNAEDLYLDVPIGTIVREIKRNSEGEIIKKIDIADLSHPEKTLLMSKGGRGGYGNAHFVSSVRRAPKFAELGEEGETIEVELELKLVADIGIIGLPSCGKSTLISVISKAKPKIAAYPFTTLIPNLGVVKIADKKTYVVADIPGLIEKAHEGKGLGIKFLKHVQRCRLLVHLLDPTQIYTSPNSKSQTQNSKQNPKLKFQTPNAEEIINSFKIINHELESFSKDLATKHQIVVLNKSDLITDEQSKELMKGLKKELGRKKRFTLYPQTISAATTEGTQELKNFLYQELAKCPKASWEEENPNLEEDTQTHILYQPHLENPKYFSVSKLKKGEFQVVGQRIEQIVNMTDMANREAMMRVYDVLKKMGISKELKKIGARDGDMVSIGKHEIDFHPEN